MDRTFADVKPRMEQWQARQEAQGTLPDGRPIPDEDTLAGRLFVMEGTLVWLTQELSNPNTKRGPLIGELYQLRHCLKQVQRELGYR